MGKDRVCTRDSLSLNIAEGLSSSQILSKDKVASMKSPPRIRPHCVRRSFDCDLSSSIQFLHPDPGEWCLNPRKCYAMQQRRVTGGLEMAKATSFDLYWAIFRPSVVFLLTIEVILLKSMPGVVYND